MPEFDLLFAKQFPNQVSIDGHIYEIRHSYTQKELWALAQREVTDLDSSDEQNQQTQGPTGP